MYCHVLIFFNEYSSPVKASRLSRRLPGSNVASNREPFRLRARTPRPTHSIIVCKPSIYHRAAARHTAAVQGIHHPEAAGHHVHPAAADHTGHLEAAHHTGPAAVAVRTVRQEVVHRTGLGPGEVDRTGLDLEEAHRTGPAEAAGRSPAAEADHTGHREGHRSHRERG